MSTKDETAGDRIRVVDLYEATPKIHARLVDGRWARLRGALRYGFLAALVIGPWIPWGDRQAILLDLPARQFHVFGATFFPQDFILVSGLLICGAFALFTFTNWLGRVWCGYTCPHSVWFQMFIDIEAWIEGPRHRRIRQDESPWTTRVWLIKARKWALWIVLAALTGVSIVGFFVPIRELLPGLVTFDVGGWTLFWVAAFTGGTLVMGAVMREQVCLYMCPYARFQSAMFDPDTLIVSYDPGRGEPRGSRPRGADPEALGLGDCIDCELCVQVCPVGIDIREGLQYECISCAHCIDACDGVMDRMGYPRDLISYTTERALAGEKPRRVRPRLIGYAAVLALMVGLFTSLAVLRTPVEIDVIRDRGALYREVLVDGRRWVENAYTVRLVNKSQDARRLDLAVDGLPAVVVDVDTPVLAGAGEVVALPLRLRLPTSEAGDVPIRDVVIRVLDENGEVLEREGTSFMSGGGTP